MRFALCVVGTMAAGGWGAGATHGLVPWPGQMLQAVTALGGDAGKGDLAKLGIIDVNPLKTYNNVMRQVTSGAKPDLGIEQKPLVVSPDSFARMPTFDPNLGAAGKNGFASGMQSQIEQNNRRMQDMAAYARNPAGWHGVPPH